MKAYVFILAMAFVAHTVTADWKEDLMKERMGRLADFVTKQTDILVSAVIINPNGGHCTTPAISQYGIALREAQTQLKLCVDRTNVESEAKACCDSRESTATSKISQATSSALSCIYSSG